MRVRVERSLLVIVVAAIVVAACAHSQPQPVAPAAKIKLVTLPVESDAFPGVAKAATTALAQAKVGGVDESIASKVSIEVVQLSIECVDPTAACYGAVAKSLAAGKLLFAQIDADGAKPKVAVTVFDVATNAPKRAERTFDTEAAAIAGLDQLVTEATR
jgi:hypothetical protein